MAETKTTTHITQVGTVIVPVSDQDRGRAILEEGDIYSLGGKLTAKTKAGAA